MVPVDGQDPARRGSGSLPAALYLAPRRLSPREPAPSDARSSVGIREARHRRPGSLAIRAPGRPRGAGARSRSARASSQSASGEENIGQAAPYPRAPRRPFRFADRKPRSLDALEVGPELRATRTGGLSGRVAVEQEPDFHPCARPSGPRAVRREAVRRVFLHDAPDSISTDAMPRCSPGATRPPRAAAGLRRTRARDALT